MTPPTSKLYITLIVLVGLVGGYIVYNQWITLDPIPAPAISSKDNISTLKNLKIDFKALDDSTYKALVTSGESPVTFEATNNKKDLFAQ